MVLARIAREAPGIDRRMFECRPCRSFEEILIKRAE
jgi:hypothetical protein